MEQLITRLDAALRQQRPDYYEVLQPGASPEALAALETAIGAPLPADLRALLAWKNGHPRIPVAGSYVYGGEPIWRGYGLMSVEEIQDSWELMTEMLEGEEFGHDDWWHRSYIPFCTNWGGDHLLLDVDAHLGGTPGQVMDWAHDVPLRWVLTDSLSKFVESIVAGLEQGLADPGTDGKRYEAVYQQLNPGYPTQIVLG